MRMFLFWASVVLSPFEDPLAVCRIFLERRPTIILGIHGECELQLVVHYYFLAKGVSLITVLLREFGVFIRRIRARIIHKFVCLCVGCESIDWWQYHQLDYSHHLANGFVWIPAPHHQPRNELQVVKKKSYWWSLQKYL